MDNQQDNTQVTTSPALGVCGCIQPASEPVVDTEGQAALAAQPAVSGGIGIVPTTKQNTRVRKHCYLGHREAGVCTLPSGTRYIMTEKGFRKVKTDGL